MLAGLVPQAASCGAGRLSPGAACRHPEPGPRHPEQKPSRGELGRVPVAADQCVAHHAGGGPQVAGSYRGPEVAVVGQGAWPLNLPVLGWLLAASGLAVLKLPAALHWWFPLKLQGLGQVSFQFQPGQWRQER